MLNDLMKVMLCPYLLTQGRGSQHMNSKLPTFIMFASWPLRILWFCTAQRFHCSSVSLYHMHSVNTGLRKISSYFLGFAFNFSVLYPPPPLVFFFYRCFLSDLSRHPGGHTWSAQHLEHLQAVSAGQSPLHTWYTCCSPHCEGSKFSFSCTWQVAEYLAVCQSEL